VAVAVGRGVAVKVADGKITVFVAVGGGGDDCASAQAASTIASATPMTIR